MIGRQNFVENEYASVVYWYGNVLVESDGKVSFFMGELEEEPFARYDGVVLEKTGVGFFPTAIWIPYDNMVSVKHQAEWG